MAIVHRSRNSLAWKTRGAWALKWALYLLLPVMALTAVWLGRRYGGDVMALGRSWGERLQQLSVGDGTGMVQTLLRYGVHVARFMPAALLASVTVVLMGAMYRGARWCSEHHQIWRAGVKGEKQALRTVRHALPDTCHVFTNKLIAWEGGVSETDLIIVGPGGVAVVEVKNYSGSITGAIGDSHLKRVKRSGQQESLPNPARQVSTHVHRLAHYLRSQHPHVWVSSAVLFVHPRLELAVDGGHDAARAGDRMPRQCVFATPETFHDAIGRAVSTQGALTRAEIKALVKCIRNAPAKP